MLRSWRWIFLAISAVLASAFVAAPEAAASGTGHAHAVHEAHDATAGHSPHDARGTVPGPVKHVGSAGAHRHGDTAPSDREDPARDAAGSASSDGAPCAGHSDDGGFCCGVACHAAMAAGPGAFALPLRDGEARLAARSERPKDRPGLLIERPPRS